jgi:hypothetical protein
MGPLVALENAGSLARGGDVDQATASHGADLHAGMRVIIS